MLKEEVRRTFNAARKSGDRLTKDALEAVIAGILQREKTEAGREVSDAEVIDCVTKEIKVQREVAELYATRDEAKAEEARGKIAVLTSFLPAQLTEEEVLAIIAESDVFQDASPKTKGAIIRTVMPKIAGRFDKSAVNGLVERHLSNKYAD